MGDVLDWVAVNAEQHPEHAFLALYDRSVDDVHRYASRLTGGDRSRAEELVQETYLGVLRRLRAGDDLELSTGYLIAACRSRFLDDLKAADRRHRREVRAALGARPSADDPADRAVHAATDALAALPPDQRAARCCATSTTSPCPTWRATSAGRSTPPNRSSPAPAPRCAPTSEVPPHDRATP